MNNETLRKRIKEGDFKDIENWDVSKVTDMGIMFHDVKSFNENISNWDVSKVTDMGIMFYTRLRFVQLLRHLEKMGK